MFSRAISLYILGSLKSPFFSFLNTIVINLQKCIGQYPAVRQWLKRRVSSSFSFYMALQSTRLGSQSSPNIVSGLIILIASSTSHILISGVYKGFRYQQLCRSSRSAGSGIKKKEPLKAAIFPSIIYCGVLTVSLISSVNVVFIIFRFWA